MFLFSKIRRATSRPQTPEVTPIASQEAESEILSFSPSKLIENPSKSPVSKRSKTFSRSFRSLRKSRTPALTMSKAFESLSKVDMTDAEDMKRLYPEYNSSDPDHNPFILRREDEDVNDSTRGRRRALSMSKIPSLRKRSQSIQRTPSPKRSFFRDTTSSLLDTSAKTLKDWASYLHKQSPLPELSDSDNIDDLKVHRSSPILIPTAPPTLAPIALGGTPFDISENVPLTARPSATPFLGPITVESETSSPDRLLLENTCLQEASPEVEQSPLCTDFAFDAPTEHHDFFKHENPFDDVMASSSIESKDTLDDIRTNPSVPNETPIVTSVTATTPPPETAHKRKSISTFGEAMIETDPPRRAPAIRRRSSPVRARTTEEALERLEKDVQVSDSESPAASICQNGSDDSLLNDWAERPTHEEIRTRFKRSKQSSTECKAMFSDRAHSPSTLHPRPLAIRTKPTHADTEKEVVIGFEKTKILSDADSQPDSGDVSSTGTPSMRKFRFANTQRRSVSPENVSLPGIIALDCKVNTMAMEGSSLTLQNRFAVLADLQQSESTSETSVTEEPNVNCKCSPCHCNSCRCRDSALLKKVQRQCLRSELSTISDLSEEERQCAGIV